jgi:hypothetical protein
MIEHLSGEQISQWMIGDRSPQLQRHVAECDECRGQLEQLESTLSQFRGAVRDWSGSTTSTPDWQQPLSPAAWFSWPRVVLSAVLLFVMVTAPLYWTARQRQRALEAERADTQLLEQVDSEISRAVPEPMEPLVNLVTWNSSPAEMKKQAERQ